MRDKTVSPTIRLGWNGPGCLATTVASGPPGLPSTQTPWRLLRPVRRRVKRRQQLNLLHPRDKLAGVEDQRISSVSLAILRSTGTSPRGGVCQPLSREARRCLNEVETQNNA